MAISDDKQMPMTANKAFATLFSWTLQMFQFSLRLLEYFEKLTEEPDATTTAVYRDTSGIRAEQFQASVSKFYQLSR